MNGEDLPKIMRLTMVFIDRVGFPILAFFMMTAVCAFMVYFVVVKGLPVVVGVETNLAALNKNMVDLTDSTHKDRQDIIREIDSLDVRRKR